MLDFYERNIGLLGDIGKRENAVRSRSPEHCFNECHQADLLAEEDKVVGEDRLRGNIRVSMDPTNTREKTYSRSDGRDDGVEFGNVTGVEGVEHVLDPFILGSHKRFEDGVHQLLKGVGQSQYHRREKGRKWDAQVHQSCKYLPTEQRSRDPQHVEFVRPP